MRTFAGGSDNILNNVQNEANSKFIWAGLIKLKGGGEIYYISNPSEAKIEQLSERMIHDACDNTNTTKKNRYQTRCKYGPDDLLRMNAKEVVVYGAGHHAERVKNISTYKKFFNCMEDANSN